MRKTLRRLTVVLSAVLLSGCATMTPQPVNPNFPKLVGKDNKNCSDPKNCHYAMVRKLDGMVIQSGTNVRPIEQDVPNVPVYGTISMPPGLHTVEIVYQCPTEKKLRAAIFQLQFAEKQVYQVRLQKQAKSCTPYITDVDGKKVKPLMKYLGD